MLNSLFIIFIVSFINKDNGFFSIPTTSKFSGIIGSKILNASLSQTASLIELSVYPSYMDEFVSSCFLPHTNIDQFPTVKSLLEEN